MSAQDIRIGGLMRCCIESLQDHIEQTEDVSEGDTHVCRHCGETMIFRDDAWQWDRDDIR